MQSFRDQNHFMLGHVPLSHKSPMGEEKSMRRFIQVVLCVNHGSGAYHFHSILLTRMHFMPPNLLLRVRICNLPLCPGIK